MDDSGNEVAGIRLPVVQAGVAAYTGWNPRRHVDGLPDVLFDLAGSRLPANANAPATAQVTEQQIRAAAAQLAADRFLLPEDVELAVQQALAELPAR